MPLLFVCIFRLIRLLFLGFLVIPVVLEVVLLVILLTPAYVAEIAFIAVEISSAIVRRRGAAPCACCR